MDPFLKNQCPSMSDRMRVQYRAKHVVGDMPGQEHCRAAPLGRRPLRVCRRRPKAARPQSPRPPPHPPFPAAASRPPPPPHHPHHHLPTAGPTLLKFASNPHRIGKSQIQHNILNSIHLPYCPAAAKLHPLPYCCRKSPVVTHMSCSDTPQRQPGECRLTGEAADASSME